MENIKLKAYAKINLSLDVKEKRPDGYHEVSMIMASISLCDEVLLSKASDISLEIKNSKELSSEDNIMIKAAKKFFEKTKINSGARMVLEKNIPIAAGMAGGSADAAAVLKGLNEIYQTNLLEDELCAIGIEIGADVPYCIKGRVMLSEGIGEKLSLIGDIKDLYIAVVKTKEGLSTGAIYNKIDNEKNLDRPDNDFLIECIKQKDYASLCKNMKNVMEQVSIKEIPEIAEIKKELITKGAMGAMMSGSGPTVFGIFEKKEECIKAVNDMKKKYFSCMAEFV